MEPREQWLRDCSFNRINPNSPAARPHEKMLEVSVKRRNHRVLLGVSILMMGVLFLSCTPPIDGELTLLVDDDVVGDADRLPLNPHWSSDGSRIFFILGDDYKAPSHGGPVWMYDLGHDSLIEIGYQIFYDFDLSPQGNLAVTDEDLYIFWIRDLETWRKINSYQPCERALTYYWDWLSQVQFSYESEHILYYAYSAPSDSIFLHRFDTADSTDEELIFTKGTKISFAPGPGDTLLALNDTIYNLTSGNKIPIDMDSRMVHWNPADPTELLGSTGDKGLFLIDLSDLDKIATHRLKVDTPKGYDVTDARFSPDGERIVLVASWHGDGGFDNQIWLFEPIE